MTEERELRSVATLVMGTSPKGETYNNDGVGMPLLNGPTEFGPVYPDCTLFTTSPLRQGEIGDLLFCVRGSTTGRMNWADRPYALGRGIAAVRCKSPLETRFARYCLEARLPSLLKRAGGGTFPNLRQVDIATFPIPWPESRHRMAAILAAYDELIENNLRRIQILEEMAQTVYREWFVNFRFPGHEDAALVDSPLGPIPEGWSVRTVADLAGGERGVIGGPFGSKLGRKDYVEAGVPVIRGANLNGSLGFDDRGFVFVSPDKFEDLRGNAAVPGDIIVTQRGTLGQVGLVPLSSPFAEFVVSQSQMRVRANTEVTSTEFVYYTLRWPSTNRRLVDHAMVAGVPHINLGILRDFEIASPPQAVAATYARMVAPQRQHMENLFRQNATLRTTRDLLLPRLVSGEIDVSDLDIDTEWLAS